VDASFNPEKCREEAFGVSWDDPQVIVLRFCADQAPYVQERTWHSTQQFVFLPDGGLEMTFHAGGQFEIRRWILGWGDAVEVISPASLRMGIERVAESMLSLYRTS
jgi:predicted DNA-binding transcriptional regulator YafY